MRVKLKKILKARARQRLNLETVKDEMVARDYRCEGPSLHLSEFEAALKELKNGKTEGRWNRRRIIVKGFRFERQTRTVPDLLCDIRQYGQLTFWNR